MNKFLLQYRLFFCVSTLLNLFLFNSVATAVPASWQQEAVLLNPEKVKLLSTDDPGKGNRFGSSIAISQYGGVMVVGVGEEQKSSSPGTADAPFGHPERAIVFESSASG